MTSQIGVACPSGSGGTCDCQEQWEAAVTLDDLARLNAQWLGGARCWSFSQGGEPDGETSELVEVLAEINSLGLITDFSQPGEFDGEWAQRASVSGYCSQETSNALLAGALATDVVVLVSMPGDDQWLRIPISRDRGHECTWIGGTTPIEDAGTDGLSSHAMGELAGAWYVQIFDPKWGRNDLLWPTVHDALRRRPLRYLPRDTWDPAPGCVSYD